MATISQIGGIFRPLDALQSERSRGAFASRRRLRPPALPQRAENSIRSTVRIEYNTHPMPDDKKDLATRTASAASIRAKHPDRIPVIVDKRSGDNALPDIDKKKFLVPADLTVGQFMYVIRKRIKLAPEQAIFLFVASGTLPPSVETMQKVYDAHHDEDGFLYMTYSGENFFGAE